MNSDSRTSNAARNIKYSFINKMLLLVAAFVARTAFIRLMGAEYTGISSLYSNILSILNLADLGFGSVMTYELYKPVRDHDEESIRVLVELFRKIYLVVFAVVLGGGLITLPILQYIVNSELDTVHLYIYYVLYLLDSACSYLIVHNRMVIAADQRYYITNSLNVACKFAQYIVQTVYLLITHDFVGYLVIQVTFTIVYNILVDAVSMRMYPYLRVRAKAHVAPEVSHRIRVNVLATFIERISETVLNQTDSIIISMMFSTIYVGYYANYNMIVYYLHTIIRTVIVSGLEASVGNLNAEGDAAKSYRIYRQLDFVLSFVYMVFAVEFTCIIQNFVHIWIGDEYLQSYLLVGSMMITFYLQQSMNLITTYRETLGLFDQVKKSYLAMALLNIMLSVILGYVIGVPGVVVATGLSRLITIFWREGQVVFRRLGLAPREYYLQQLRNAVVAIMSLTIAFVICSLLNGLNVYVQIVLKSCMVVSICTLIYYILYHKSDEWKWAMGLVRSRLHRG